MMHTGSLCLFFIACAHFNPPNIAVATPVFHPHLGERFRDLEDPDTSNRNADFSEIRGKEDLDVSLPNLYGDSESLQGKIYNVPIIFYNLYDREGLAPLLDMMTGATAEVSTFIIPEEIKSFQSKKAIENLPVATISGFHPSRGKKSFEEYDEY